MGGQVLGLQGYPTLALRPTYASQVFHSDEGSPAPHLFSQTAGVLQEADM